MVTGRHGDVNWRAHLVRMREVVVDEFAGLNGARVLGGAVGLIPAETAPRLRASLLRCGGWCIGEGATLCDVPRLGVSTGALANLRIGNGVFVNVGCYFELSAGLVIGDGAAIAHEVLVLTSSHRVGAPDRRAGVSFSRPVTIGPGAWIGARAVIMPGVNVGAGAIVGAGAVVTHDVADHTMVAGVPARLIRAMSIPEPSSSRSGPNRATVPRSAAAVAGGAGGHRDVA